MPNPSTLQKDLEGWRAELHEQLKTAEELDDKPKVKRLLGRIGILSRAILATKETVHG